MSEERQTVIRERPEAGGRAPGQEKKFLAASFLLALATALLIFGHTRRIERQYTRDEPAREVLVARRTIAADTVILPEHLGRLHLPVRGLSERSITPERADWIIGQAARWTINRGEPILWTDLGLDRPGGLSQRIPDGYRSIAISVDSVAAVSGLLRPLDRVDIIGIFEGNDAIVILQDVSVLSVGQTMDGTGPGPAGRFASVNLLVDLQEAQTLSLAQQRGRLQLALRNPYEDDVSEKVPRTTYREILDQGRPAQHAATRRVQPAAERGRPLTQEQVIEQIVAGRRVQ